MQRKEYLSNYYQTHKSVANERSKVNKAKMKQELKILLGSKCVLCERSVKLIFHHKKYDTSSGKPSFKSYQQGSIVLLCTYCHHILNHLSWFRNKGQLDKAITLLNHESIYNRALTPTEITTLYTAIR